MRLPEAKIKEALAHPDKLVRQEALLYFADCYSRDAEVMPLAIQAIQAYGRSQAFLHVHMVAQLAQTEATVEWAIKELHREVDKANDLDSFFPALSRLLCSADPQLIAPRADQILQAPGFIKELAPELREHLQLASWDADQCWKELERICAEGVGKHSSSDVDLGHAGRVVEALARQGEKYVDRILDLLAEEVEGAVGVLVALPGQRLHDPAGVAEVHVRRVVLADALDAEALQFVPVPGNRSRVEGDSRIGPD